MLSLLFRLLFSKASLGRNVDTSGVISIFILSLALSRKAIKQNKKNTIILTMTCVICISEHLYFLELRLLLSYVKSYMDKI